MKQTNKQTNSTNLIVQLRTPAGKSQYFFSIGIPLFGEVAEWDLLNRYHGIRACREDGSEKAD